MKHRLFAILAVLALLTAASVAQTTVYIVRHTEKITTPGLKDPGLTEAGRARAAALAKALRSARLDHCYGTQYARTQKSVEPAARAAGLKVKIYKAGGEADFAKKIRAGKAGKNILIAGHSNTVPTLVKELGLDADIIMGEKDYDDLLVVTITREGKASLLHLHYGAANPK